MTINCSWSVGRWEGIYIVSKYWPIQKFLNYSKEITVYVVVYCESTNNGKNKSTFVYSNNKNISYLE